MPWAPAYHSQLTDAVLQQFPSPLEKVVLALGDRLCRGMFAVIDGSC